MMTFLQIFIFITGTRFVTGYFQFGQTETLHICVGSKAYLDFGYNTDENVKLIEWYFNATNELITMAQYNLEETVLENEFTSPGTYHDRVIRDKENVAALTLENIKLKDEGEYMCYVTVQNKQYHARLDLKVTKPPSEEPFMRQLKRSDGSIALRCKLMGDYGKPPVELHIEDEHYFEQSAIEITISDDKYKCCMKGIAVRCFNNSGKMKYCAMPINSDLLCSENQITHCILTASVLSAVIDGILFFGWSSVIWYSKGLSLRNLFRWKTIPHSIKTAMIIWIISYTFNFFVEVVFCKYHKGCKEIIDMLWIGLACTSVSVLSAIFMSIAYRVTDQDKRDQKLLKDGRLLQQRERPPLVNRKAFGQVSNPMGESSTSSFGSDTQFGGVAPDPSEGITLLNRGTATPSN